MKNQLLPEKEPLAMALGFFDGVHLGHGALLQKVKETGLKSSVFTFDQHPSTLLEEKPVPLLSSTEDRMWLMKHHYHMDQVLLSSFSELCSMPWEVFIQDFLKNKHHVTHIVAGHDFHFGKGGQGTPEKMQEKCKKLGMTCDIIPPVSYGETVVSSTHIRKLLQDGKLEEANHFLGHPHVLSNRVQHGKKIGTNELGFPTVNLSLPEGVLCLPFGVYACMVWVGESSYRAVTNVGIRPTVEESSTKKVTVEGYILDFPGYDLYGEVLRMEFFTFLRGEKKFKDFKELSKQIEKDVQATDLYFSNKK